MDGFRDSQPFRRINQPTDRKDFLTKILQHRHTDNLSDVQVAAHSSDFVYKTPKTFLILFAFAQDKGTTRLTTWPLADRHHRIAGSETTATALSCVTYYLQKSPESLHRLREEVRGYFKSFDDIDDASATGLPFLNAVILEGMRMYPPLPFPLPRIVPCDGGTIDGYFVPGGTVVSTNPFASSMSPSNFHDPWIFKPQRWMDLRNKDVLSSSQPFSLGPRSCLGKSLGWLEMRTILAKIHFKYDLELVDPNLDWHAGSEMHTLWQKPQMNIIVRSRSDCDT
ncbi:Benzoate 4-monooxygenase cytochrome p450 [Colletotrichum higginsianum IMI 349063]|uniref:Benzoate 4-monooxygenase cytochrome p450 n=1 Tax=Colletotrichum higginsianum (strain IMI 349063) TaxID=759273 RepID=A0A1B7XTS7_COLHI|nr:Benzoate 4-monooxygenase cytochrome p450 [Colletotrichum higginsianum IMI 349063]XP_018152839.1 Benzoate 4-monooxygenase cytochrome p450 [Colletotrichum higginsianum IMI 349063]OBR03158.1 Benzoate 4-monooxygenase cytochrome p450 [Colletotrichum higginsianum IMI 349063]OBR04321.1 Benzoate 4-monooxygenase cytochrome p450 [Colletotrichum higginsianum IMI 349063]